MNNDCSYCGSTSWGVGCRFNPMPDGTFDSMGCGLHVHPNDPNHCRFCGSSSYGNGCAFNKPSGLHVKGVGGDRCVYCGSRSKGSGCKFNPTGFHDPVGSNVTPVVAKTSVTTPYRSPAAAPLDESGSYTSAPGESGCMRTLRILGAIGEALGKIGGVKM